MDAATLGDRLWWDKGSSASSDVTVWHPHTTGAIKASTFVGIPNYNDPPNASDLERLRGTIGCLAPKYVASKLELDKLLTDHPDVALRVTV